MEDQFKIVLDQWHTFDSQISYSDLQAISKYCNDRSHMASRVEREYWIGVRNYVDDQMERRIKKHFFTVPKSAPKE